MKKLIQLATRVQNAVLLAISGVLTLLIMIAYELYGRASLRARRTYRWCAALQAGLLLRGWSLWIGVQYSEYDKRVCINVLPCVTVWITLPGGNVPGAQHA